MSREFGRLDGDALLLCELLAPRGTAGGKRVCCENSSPFVLGLRSP